MENSQVLKPLTQPQWHRRGQQAATGAVGDERWMRRPAGLADGQLLLSLPMLGFLSVWELSPDSFQTETHIIPHPVGAIFRGSREKTTRVPWWTQSAPITLQVGAQSWGCGVAVDGVAGSEPRVEE